MSVKVKGRNGLNHKWCWGARGGEERKEARNESLGRSPEEGGQIPRCPEDGETENTID